MSLTPRAVVVYRPTELEELVGRHGTRGQAAFFLSTRGRQIEEVEERHERQAAAIRTVTAAIPLDWRRGSVMRSDLPRFLFDPENLVVAVGQDGLVANVAKYLQGQPVLGVNPDPARNPGVLVAHRPERGAAILGSGAEPSALPVEELTMVEAAVDDGQRLRALNEVFIGPASHQTARYRLALPEGRVERQASSGLIVSTGTGATGWSRSISLERHSSVDLPAPTADQLAWFVREAWPSPATGTELTEGSLRSHDELRMTVESDRLVAFGDGIEADSLAVTWGQTVRLCVSDQRLRLVH
jgi:hypothetical protein